MQQKELERRGDLAADAFDLLCIVFAQQARSPIDRARLDIDTLLAMRGLMERYRRPLFGYLCRLLDSTEDAEDLFQETFLRVLRHVARFQTDLRFRPWLYAIATAAAFRW